MFAEADAIAHAMQTLALTEQDERECDREWRHACLAAAKVPRNGPMLQWVCEWLTRTPTRTHTLLSEGFLEELLRNVYDLGDLDMAEYRRHA
jgi:hypothetical protein